MKKQILLITVLFLALLPAGSAFADGPVRSLLIGCDLFVSMPDTAPASDGNTERMAELITAFVPDAAEPVRSVNAVGDAETLRQLIGTAFSGATEDSVSWIYISTHGILRDGKTRLLLSDGEKELLLDAEGLKALTDEIPGTVILILDACHSGGLIGKGTEGYVPNVFAGEKYTVLTSCGGEEDSWLWSSAEDSATGAGYFTAALRAALSPVGRKTADRNGDSVLTLTETRLALEDLLGASTVRTWPEEAETPLFALSGDAYGAGPECVSFSAGLPEPLRAEVPFSFLTRRDTKILYQIVRWQDGKWDFQGATVLKDGKNGTVHPGYQSRSLVLHGEEKGGYALVQLIHVLDGIPDLCAEHLVCVPASEGDPGLRTDLFLPEDGILRPGEELCFAVRCALPCGLTVTVTDAEGKPVRYLMNGQGTRPQNAEPEGLFLCWNGRDRSGEPVPDGKYRIRVTTEIGGARYEHESELFELRQPAE